MEQQIDLTDVLGFYFMVFQRTLSGKFVKCFIDGDPDYTYLEVDSLLDMTRKKGYNPLTNQLRDCLDTTSMYVWDVSNNTIQRLSASSDPDESIMDLIKGKMEEVTTERKRAVSTTSFDISSPFIKRTKEGILSLFR